jgi:hypothetical protein
MTQFTFCLVGAFVIAQLACAQQAPSASPGAASESPAAGTSPLYTPPTHGERFRTYLSHTYGIASVLEAGARAGVDQARDAPSQWPEGAEGYAERFGSAVGGIAVRGTTQYAFGELFREDLRHQPCGSNCSTSKFKLALEDTFMARKGSDGHLAFSAARLIGPISSGLVVSTWRPGGFEQRNVVREIGLNYSFVFVRNLVRELARH